MQYLNTTFWKFVVGFFAIILAVLIMVSLMGEYTDIYGDQTAGSSAR